MDGYRIVYRVHVRERMRERNISEDEVAHSLKFGTTIESYPDDTPYPSELILCWCGDRPIHVVVSTIEVDSVMFIRRRFALLLQEKPSKMLKYQKK